MKRWGTLVATVAAGLVASALLAGCGDDDAPGGRAPDGRALDDGAAWRTSTAPLPREGLTWALGSTVHLPDGRTVDTRWPVEEYAVAGDGVFFLPDGDAAGDEVRLEDGAVELHFAAPGEEPVGTGLPARSEHFTVSPDGSRLAVLDVDEDDASAAMRLFDLSTGEVTTSTDGTDPSGLDDPEWLLDEMEVRITGADDDEVHARVIRGTYVYDWETGEGRPAEDGEDAPGEFADPLVSPDASWRIRTRRERDDLVARTGERLALDVGTERWTLFGWRDARTAVGYAISGPGRGYEVGPEDRKTLMTCTVPDGSCELVPGTTSAEGARLPLGWQVLTEATWGR